MPMSQNHCSGLTVDHVSVLKKNKEIFRGTRLEVAEFLGLRYPNASKCILKGWYKDYKFEVISPIYEIYDDKEVIFRGTRKELFERYPVQRNYFYQILLGRHKLMGLYHIRRVE